MTRRVKVVAHVHSAWSYDASWSLPRIARAFGRLNVDVVLMSEHDDGFDQARWVDYVAACADASMPSTLLVPGIEYADADNAIHVPVWGDGAEFVGSGLGTRTVLDVARESGSFSVLAHPSRRDAWRRFDPAWFPLLSGIEVWNRKYDGWAPDRRAATVAADTGIPAFVSLDFHTRRQFFPLGLALEVEEPLTPSAVYAALGRGAFRPLMAGIPAVSLTRGLPYAALRGAETLRRRAASVARRVTDGRTSGRAGLPPAEH